MLKKSHLSQKQVSIIVPVYNEASNLEILYNKIKNIFTALPSYNWELIFINDGSTDNSWEVIVELTDKDSRVSGICLSRNFGKEMALTAGVESVPSTDAVIMIDADLQHPPEKIPDFLHEWRNGSEIVVGIRKGRGESSIAKRIGSKLFYKIMKLISDVDIPPNSTDFRLLDKILLETLQNFSERTRMFRGLVDWMGFKKTFLYFSAPPRLNGGTPNYSYKKLFQLALNSITSFSLLPLRITGYMGLLVTFLTVIVLTYMVSTDLLDLQVYTPQAYFIVFNTFLVGILLSAIGMLALYIGHIHTEVVGRPLYIVKSRVGRIKKVHQCEVLSVENKKNKKGSQIYA